MASELSLPPNSTVIAKTTTVSANQADPLLNIFMQRNPLGVIQWNTAFEVVEWNPAAAAIFGYSRKEALGQRGCELIVLKDIRAQVDRGFQALLAQEAGECSVNENITKDGRIVTCEWTNTPLVEAGAVIGVISMVQDISDRSRSLEACKAAEQALRQSEARWKDLFLRTADAILVFDPEQASFIDCNQAAAAMMGYANRDDLIGLGPLAISPELQPDGTSSLEKAIALIAQTTEQGSQRFEWLCRRLNGEPLWLEVVLTVMTLDHQPVFQCLWRDISDRKAAEVTLRQQEEFLRSIYNNVECFIFVIDVLNNGDFHYVSYNRSCELFSGLSSAEIAGKTPEQLFGDIEGLHVRTALQQCVTLGIATNQEEHITFKGEERWTFSTFNPVRDQQNCIHRIIGTSFDITQLKHTQAALQDALQESEYQSCLLRTVLDSSPDWIFAKDRELRYILANQSFVEALGTTTEAMLGKTDRELGVPEEMIVGNFAQGVRGYEADDRAALAGEPVFNAYDPTALADGSIRIFDSRKVPLRNSDAEIFAMLGVCRDLTDRYEAEAVLRQSEAQIKEKAAQLEQALQELQRTQAQLVQTEKMSSLGQLVAGVAHEINNPVNFIYGNLSHADNYTQDLLSLLLLYQQHYAEPPIAIQERAADIDVEFLIDDLPKLLNSMRVGADRIQKIVASLRNFSRMDEAEMKAVDIHDGIESTLMILQSRLKLKDQQTEIEVIREYGNLPLVECYAGQLNQVFMNVLSNAIDALEEGMGNGKSPLSPVGDRPSPIITIQTQRTDSNHVEIRIADNGTGMPEQVRQRLFDPFFTTKPVGKGTGMGLSISYQIVTEKHGGTIHCVSEPRQGTEFIIQIPLHQLGKF